MLNRIRVVFSYPFLIPYKMEYKIEFKDKPVYLDIIKGFLVCNEENKSILIKFLPNIFVEITNFSKPKRNKRVSSTKTKSE